MACLLFACWMASGQVAQWLIRPEYDTISFAEGADRVVTDSSGVSIFWTFDGRRVLATDDYVCPFIDGVAVTVKKGAGFVTGFYDLEGVFTPIEKERYKIQGDIQGFSDGYLLLRDRISRNYFYIDKKGRFSSVGFLQATPFRNGLASCNLFSNQEKMKDPVFALLNANLTPMSFSFNNKEFSPDDIDFISSVNDEKVGVLIHKKKVYLLHAEDLSLTLLCGQNGEQNPKTQAKLQDEVNQVRIMGEDASFMIPAKCGKEGVVLLHFDAHRVLRSIDYVDGTKTFADKNETARIYRSPAAPFGKGPYGLRQGETEILPPQFDEAPFCFDDKAMVKKDGKYGLLKMYPEEPVSLSLYKGRDIPFKHQTFETFVRLDLPQVVSSGDAVLDVNPESGCTLDMTSAEMKDTPFGNYVQYNCTLQIPQNLRDDEMTEVVYPACIRYDGFVSPAYEIKAKAWHFKYINIDINNSDVILDEGNVSFIIDISADRAAGEEYPLKLSVTADTLAVDYEKLSETRYKCKVMALAEGINNIVIEVTEQGCPTTSYPYEIVYTKPVEQTKTQPAKAAAVSIKKKEKKKSGPIPTLEM